MPRLEPVVAPFGRYSWNFSASGFLHAPAQHICVCAVQPAEFAGAAAQKGSGDWLVCVWVDAHEPNTAGME